MSLIEKIKNIIEKYIKDRYFEYLNENNLLFINSDKLNDIISNFYSNNIKKIKTHIRNTLKNEMGHEYPSGTIENILLDIFQDSDLNINILTKEIQEFQNENYMKFIVNNDSSKNGLGLQIDIEDNFCIIKNVKDFFYDKNILNYKYLYSINDNILHNINDLKNNIQNIIKSNINNSNINNSEISLVVYKKIN